MSMNNCFRKVEDLQFTLEEFAIEKGDMEVICVIVSKSCRRSLAEMN